MVQPYTPTTLPIRCKKQEKQEIIIINISEWKEEKADVSLMKSITYKCCPLTIIIITTA